MNKPYIIGVAGGSASGKTTLSNLLNERLVGKKVKLFHLDEYYKKPVCKIKSPITGVIYDDYNHPDSLEIMAFCEDLAQAGKQDFDCIIVEGLFVLSLDNIREALDLKVYVDCQADERIIRRIKRNMEWGQTIEEITTVYLDAVRYRHSELVEPSKWHADIIMNGSTSSEAGVQILLEWIKEKIKSCPLH